MNSLIGGNGKTDTSFTDTQDASLKEAKEVEWII
jgi:hypothetical protein